MAFNFQLMFRILFKSVAAYHQTGARFTFRRALFLILSPIFYVLLEGITWFCFSLDEIFFRRYRDIAVKKPLFIVGYPRSGTTFIHRLCARDSRTFTSLRMWEILFAPSITQKKFWRFVGACDRKAGAPLRNLISAFEKRLPSELQAMHEVGLFEPEEDDLIHLHIFSTAFLVYPFPFDEVKTFLRFDTDLEPALRGKIMNFYKRCIQCHLYVYGREKRFLSKNPSFSGKVRSLFETFPDCKILCMVRTPLEAVPSAVSWMSYGFKCYNSVDDRILAEEIPKGIYSLYFYPRNQLKKFPPDRGAVLRYEDLMADPATFVKELYSRFGMDIRPAFGAVLKEVAEKNKNYKSRHTYSLESHGLSREKIIRDYKKIFDEFYPDQIRKH